MVKRTIIRAQMKIQQTALMLMAITLLFVLVGLFFLSFKMSNLKESVNTLEEKNAIILASKLSENSEFSCGEAFGTRLVNCMDSDKLLAFMADSEKYRSFFGIKGMEVKKITMEEEENMVCTYENYPNCNTFLIFEGEGGFTKTSFVSLCRKEKIGSYFENKCELAQLIISYEKKY